MMPGCDKSRVSVMIKNGIEYKRMDDMENPDTSEIWIRLKLSKRKFAYILCYYRQWCLPSEIHPLRASLASLKDLQKY